MAAAAAQRPLGLDILVPSAYGPLKGGPGASAVHGKAVRQASPAPALQMMLVSAGAPQQQQQQQAAGRSSRSLGSSGRRRGGAEAAAWPPGYPTARRTMPVSTLGSLVRRPVAPQPSPAPSQAPAPAPGTTGSLLLPGGACQANGGAVRRISTGGLSPGAPATAPASVAAPAGAAGTGGSAAAAAPPRAAAERWAWDARQLAAQEVTTSQQRSRPPEPRTPQREAAASPKEPDETPTKVNSPWPPRRCNSSGSPGPGGAVPTPQGRLGASGSALRARSLARRPKSGPRASYNCSATGPEVIATSIAVAGTPSKEGQPQDPSGGGLGGRLQVRGEHLAPPPAALVPRSAPGPISGEAQRSWAYIAREWDLPPLEDFSVASPRFGAEAARRSPEELPMPLRQQLHFIRSLPELPCSEITFDAERGPFLPPRPPQAQGRPTLVLDLDETLVHCRRGPRTSSSPAPPDLLVQFDESPEAAGAVLFRPFVNFFLDAAAKFFEIVVFTASQQVYADKVIDALDPTGLHIAHRLYRQHCTELRGAFFKELSLLGRPVRHCILVDNSPISVACNPNQGVLIRSWYGDQEDQELVELLSTLQELRGCDGGPDAYLASRYGLQDFFNGLRGELPAPSLAPPPPAPAWQPLVRRFA